MKFQNHSRNVVTTDIMEQSGEQIPNIKMTKTCDKISCRLQLKRRQFLKFGVLEVTFPIPRAEGASTRSARNPLSASKRSAKV